MGGHLYQLGTTAPLEIYPLGCQAEQPTHSVDELSSQIETSGERKTYKCFFALHFQLPGPGAYWSCQEQIETQVLVQGVLCYCCVCMYTPSSCI